MKRFAGPLAILACTLIWGTAFLAQKSGCDHFGPFTLTCYRNILAGLFLLGSVVCRNRFAGRPHLAADGVRRTWLGGFLSGTVLFAAMATQQLGIEETTPGVSAFLTANYILLVPLFAWGIGMGRPGWSIWLGVGLALVGTFFICANTGAETFRLGTGEAWTLACAALFALQIMVVDRFAPGSDVLVFSMVQTFTAALCASPFILLPSEAARLSWAHLQVGWFSLFYLGVMSSGIAYTLQNIGQARTPAALAAIVMSFESVVGAVSGWLVRGDALSPRQTLGCALVFAAILFSQFLGGERGGGRQAQ